MLAAALVTTTMVGLTAGPTAEAGTAGSMGFGMGISDIKDQENRGVPPDYAVFWVGAWTSGSQWDAVDRNLQKAQANGVTPVIQFFYWGNDISRDCLENGCWSDIHQTHKSKEDWWDQAGTLAWHLDKEMDGQEAIVVLETEFNKNGVETYEPLDRYLRDMAGMFQDQAPGTQVALGFGNWGRHTWDTFDRAAQASDMISLQGLRASTQDAQAHYRDVVDETLRGIKTADRLFDRPTLLTDLGLSTYPEPKYLEQQKHELWELFDRMDELRAAGLTGVIYRAFFDNPQANTDEYYGQAEKHWGLAWENNRSVKPAFWVWKDGVQAVRAGGGSGSAGDTSSAGSGSSGTPAPFPMEAEAFETKTAGGQGYGYGSSADRYWNLWTDGQIAQGFEADHSGTYEIKVDARGQVHDGEAPRMSVLIDGHKQARRDVWVQDSWHTYTVETHIEQGWHKLQLRFLNDAYDDRGDRNLLLDRVTVTPAE